MPHLGLLRPAIDGARKDRALTIVATIARLSLGVVFIGAAASKFAFPYAFLSSVYSYGILGAKFGLWATQLLPWIELTVGAALILRVAEAGAFTLATFLALLFAIAKAFAIHQDRQISCGCVLGESGGVVGVGDLSFALAMFAGAIIGLYQTCSRKDANYESSDSTA